MGGEGFFIFLFVTLAGVVIFLLFNGNEKSSDDAFDKIRRLEGGVEKSVFAHLQTVGYSDFAGYKAESDSLREAFQQSHKPKQYFEYLNYIDGTMMIKFEVLKHHHALQRNLEKRIVKNDYGAVLRDERLNEVSEFLDSIDYPRSEISFDVAAGHVLATLETIVEQLKSQGFDPSTIPEDGLAFENWVATNLKKFGWDAEATKGSGDQGLDVIAKKNGKRVGVQCKLYSSNVGNKAVQEIISAKEFFNLDAAVVITNAGYTKSARDLARKCNVHLLTHYDIPRFDDLFLDP